MHAQIPQMARRLVLEHVCNNMHLFFEEDELSGRCHRKCRLVDDVALKWQTIKETTRPEVICDSSSFAESEANIGDQ